MELRQEIVHIYKHGYSEIAKLFKESFPEGEQFPLWALRLLTTLKPAKFSAFYDGDTLAGILYSIESEDYFFILYLAVNPKIRSCGYGGKILEYAFEEAGDRPVVLNVETLDENAENNEQRKRRNKFYARHDIIDTGYIIEDDGVTYSVLCSNLDRFSPKSYENMLLDISFGVLNRGVTKKIT